MKISFNSEEILSMIIYKLKKYAEDLLGKRVKNTILTVPLNFNNSQRVTMQEDFQDKYFLNN